jgi:hypothetical protein
MPGVYDKFGVKFLYPENWTITDEEAEDWPKAVTVQSPQGGFWTLHIYEGGVNISQLVREAVEALRVEYADLEAEELLQPEDGTDYGYDVNFYYLDLIVTAQVRGVLLPGKALLWLTQAESREFDEYEPVFRVITMSLLGKVPMPASESTAIDSTATSTGGEHEDEQDEHEE